MFDCLWHCHSFCWLTLNPFTMVHQYTFKQSYNGYAKLLMSQFWHICFVLGLIPSKIIYQSRTVINIYVWLSHYTLLINVLIAAIDNVLYCEIVTILPIPSALALLNPLNIYPLFCPLIKHTLPFLSTREHVSIGFESNSAVLMWNLSWLCESANQWCITQLLNLSVPVALHLNHSADFIFPSSLVFHLFCLPKISLCSILILIHSVNQGSNYNIIIQIIWIRSEQKWMPRLDALSCLIEL